MTTSLAKHFLQDTLEKLESGSLVASAFEIAAARSDHPGARRIVIEAFQPDDVDEDEQPKTPVRWARGYL